MLRVSRLQPNRNVCAKLSVVQMLTKEGSGIPIYHVLEDTKKSLKTQITKWSIVPDQIPQHTFNQASFVGLFSEGTVTKINEDRRKEAAWPSDKGAGLEIRRSRVQVPPWPRL